MPDYRTKAQRNKAIRQEALREQLASQGHVQHVVEIIEKLQDVATPIDRDEVARLSKAADLRLRLIAKYVPDLKAVEIEDNRNPLEEMTDAERYAEFQRILEAVKGSADRVDPSGEAGSRKH